MSFTNSKNLNYDHTFASLLDVDVLPYVAGDIIRVNSTGTGLEEVTPTSLVGPVIGTGTISDIPVFSGLAPPVFLDSGVSISDIFGTKIIKTSTPTDPIKLQSDQGSVTVESGTSNVIIRADDVTGAITIQSANQQMIAFNTISIAANQQITIQGSGGSQILIDTSGNVTISSGFSGGLSLLANGGNSRWIFDPSSNSAGNLIFPSVPPVGECVLKINSIDNLMYWDPVIGP